MSLRAQLCSWLEHRNLRGIWCNFRNRRKKITLVFSQTHIELHIISLKIKWSEYMLNYMAWLDFTNTLFTESRKKNSCSKWGLCCWIARTCGSCSSYWSSFNHSNISPARPFYVVFLSEMCRESWTVARKLPSRCSGKAEQRRQSCHQGALLRIKERNKGVLEWAQYNSSQPTAWLLSRRRQKIPASLFHIWRSEF